MAKVPRLNKTIIEQGRVDTGAIDAAGSVARAAGGFLDAGVDMLVKADQAQAVEALSRAQVDVAALEAQYQVDYESNPQKGFDELKTQRAKILDSYSSTLGGPGQKAFSASKVKLETQSDMSQQSWVVSQSRKNAIASVGRTMDNNFKQAMLDGEAYGKDPSSEARSASNYQLSLGALSGFGEGVIGSESTRALLDSYPEDYTKSFISGVAETNPLEALSLLDQEDIKDSFKDHAEYKKMKSAIEDKAFNFQEIATQREALNILKSERELSALAQSGEPIGFAQLQDQLNKSGASEQAKDYILQKAGFKKASGSALSPDEKLEIEDELYNEIIDFSLNENPTAEQIAGLQNKVYEALSMKAITQSRGSQFLNGIVGPVVASKEEALSQFDIGAKSRIGTEFKLGKDKGLGFAALDEVINDATIPMTLNVDGSEKVTAKNDRARRYNNELKLELYNSYYENLERFSAEQNLQVGDLPKQPRSVQRAIYQKAQAEAKYDFWTNKYPELSGVKKEDFPSAVIQSDGTKIKTGIVNPKAGATVTAPTIQNIDIDNMTEEELDRFLAQ